MIAKGINVLLPLLATGSPGLIRLAFVLIAESILDINDFGRFNSDLAVAMIISFFTTNGWSCLVAVKMPKVDEALKGALWRQLITTMLLSCFISILPAFVLSYYGVVDSMSSVIVFIFGWGIYQLCRHLFLSKKRYIQTIFIDVVCIVLFVTLFTLDSGLELIFLLGMSYSLIYLYSFKNYRYEGVLNKEDVKTSLSFSFTAFLSGAITLALIPYVSMKYGLEYAGLIGLALSLISILLLVPRALSTYYMPDLAVNYDKPIKRNSIFIYFSRLTYVSLFILGALLVFLVVFYFDVFFETLSNVAESNLVVLSFIFLAITQQLALPVSVFLMTQEDSESILKSNFVLLLSVLIIICGDYYWNDTSAINLVYLLLSISCFSLMRFIGIVYFASKKYGVKL